MKLIFVRVGCLVPLDGPVAVISGFVVVAEMPLGDGQIESDVRHAFGHVGERRLLPSKISPAAFLSNTPR